MNIQPFIKWSGSKRSQVKHIIPLFPKKIKTYFEPFLGSGAILGHYKPDIAICGDIYEPLINLWIEIQKKPDKVMSDYSKKWDKLQKSYTFYYKIRDKFNNKKDPLDLLFLSRTCVNGLMRFNLEGKFNNSLHYTRPGIHPIKFEKITKQWTETIKNYKFVTGDYRETTKCAQKGDFIYLDPPYFHTKSRYIENINYIDFIEYLEKLNKKEIKYILSYDGTRGEKEYKTELPKHLFKRHLLLKSGNSPFRKLQDKKNEMVRESIYINY